MATKTQKVHVAMDFHHERDDEFVSTMKAVALGFYGNKAFSSAPVDEATFNAQMESYSNALITSKDGGRKAVAEKNKQRSASSKMLSKLARHVQEIAGDDLSAALSSGFQAYVGPPPQLPLAQPVIDKVAQVNSGEAGVSPSSVAGARIYEIQFGAVGPGGAPPASWTTVQSATARPVIIIKGLTPGVMYAFQVRAFGKLGWTPWSDSVMKMST